MGMSETVATEITDADWALLQTRLGGHLLQSADWAQFQRTLGREIVRMATDEWSSQAVIMRARGTSYLYVPYGPTITNTAQLTVIADHWRTYARDHKLDFVRFEPMGTVNAADVRKLGAVPVGEVQPQHTAVLDLDLGEEQLRTALDSGHRNRINGTERRGLSFRESSDPADGERFLELMHQTTARTGFTSHPDAYFRTLLETLLPLGIAKLYLAIFEERVVSASIAFDYNGTRYYAHNAADLEARKVQANVSLVWHMIMDAKAQGLHVFDFWGIAPEGAPATHPWAGFTEFKLAYGTTSVEYAGTWDLPVNKLKYRLYTTAKRALKRR